MAKRNFLEFVFEKTPGMTFLTSKSTGLITLKIENKGFYNRVAQKFFKRPAVSKIDLDKYGSEAWKAVDGNKTVNEIVDTMVQAFPNEEGNMQERTCQFLMILSRHKYIREVKQ